MRRSDQGTEGILSYPNFKCCTLELPWRDNAKSISCIPAEEYDVELKLSNKYGRIYWVTKVPDRTGILIHSGNYAGDISKGFKSHVMGCILLGKEMGFLGRQRAILNSRITVREFMEVMNYQPFKLKIWEKFGG
jgi:hypothetical protein